MKSLDDIYFLPNVFKRIGLSLIAIHFLTIVCYGLIVEFYAPNLSEIVPEWFLTLFRFTIMFGLILYLTAQERYEDELIGRIRLKSYQYGLYLTALISFILYLVDIVGTYTLNLNGLDGINSMLIYITGIYKFNLYRIKNND